MQDPIPLSDDVLQEVRTEMAAEEWGSAMRTLRSIQEEDLDRPTRILYAQLSGQVAWQREDWDGAIRYYGEFLHLRGPGADVDVAARRLFTLGGNLLDGTTRAFGFIPNRTRGMRTLENLALWAPRHPLAPQCFALIGNYSFEEGNYADAAHSYREILAGYGGSEWVDLATYRIGMCSFRRVEGPWTDGRLITMARDQFVRYLEIHPDGRFRTEAEEMVGILHAMEAEREKMLGDYYATIGNDFGARMHLARAAAFPDTPAAEAAAAQLAAMESTPEED